MSACILQVLLDLLNHYLIQQPTFIPLHQSYFQYISIIMVMGAQNWISEGVAPDLYYDLSLPHSVKYFCIWIKPHILQTVSWLKSDELPRWFKNCTYFGGIKAKSQNSTDYSFFFFNPVSFCLFFVSFPAQFQFMVSSSDIRAIVPLFFSLLSVTWLDSFRF